MRVLKIEIELENAAFTGDWFPEVTRILNQLIEDEFLYIDHQGDSKKLMDVNGNHVGWAKMTHRRRR